MITKAVRRLIGGLLWPLSRPLAVALVWSHRHTIGLWARSVSAELGRGGPIDVKRLSTLVQALWRVSTDARLRRLGEIRTIGFDDDAITDISTGTDARASALRATLLGVPGVVSVEVVGTDQEQPLTTAVA